MNFEEIELQERLQGRKPTPHRLDFIESFVDKDIVPEMAGPKIKQPTAGAKRKQTQQGGSAQKRARAPNMQIVRSVRAPIARGALVRNMMPASIATNRGLILSHTEPLSNATMVVLGALSVNSFALIPIIFPYLNGIAANFAKWKWLKLKIYYVPACPTSTAGEVAMANFYDWNDNITAATFIQTATMKNGISFPPWGGGHESGGESVSITVDVNEFDKPRYAYVTGTTFNALSNSDKNNYSPVNLLTATQGSAVAVPIAGRFWCRYTIQLLDPIASGLNG